MTAYEKLTSEQSLLYDQLERYELSGDTAAAQKVIQRIVAVEAAMSKIDAQHVAQSDAVEQPIAATVTAVQTKENHMATKVSDVVTLESIGVDAAVAGSPVTMEQIGVAKFVRPFAGQAMLLTEKGELSFNGYPVAFPVEDSDILLLQAPTSKLTKEYRIHLEQREDVKRAARGLALYLGGAVQADGSISNGAGGTYQVVDGQCFKLTEFRQTNFDGSKTIVRQPEACKGLLDKNGNATMRCKHQWALEFAAGAFVTCSRKFFALVIQAEMANIIGDEEAAEFAKKTFETWKENGEVRQAARVAIAQAINDARNTGNVDERGLIPAATGVFDLALDGKTLKDLIVETQGRMFSVQFAVEVPMGNGTHVAPMKTRMCKNAADFASAAAPIVMAAKRAGKAPVVTAFNA